MNKIQNTIKNIFNKYITDNKIINSDKYFKYHISPLLEYHIDLKTAFQLTKIIKKKPQEIADELSKILTTNKEIISEVFVKNCFINIKFTDNYLNDCLKCFLKDEQINIIKGKSVDIEVVSANPTGDIHIGHIRNGIVGSILGNIYKKKGWSTSLSYYLNDAGVQINMVGLSVYIKYLSYYDINWKIPDACYKSKEINDAAITFKDLHGDKYLPNSNSEEVSKDLQDILNKFSVKFFFTRIKEDLDELNINIDKYYYESYYLENKDKFIDNLKKKNVLYKQDGALWMKTSLYNDDKDRVIVKTNGEITYFLPDAIYHYDKISQDYDLCIDIWGADHHSYMTRILAGIEAQGGDSKKMKFIILQMIRLEKDEKTMKMSKRLGTNISFRDLKKIIPNVDNIKFLIINRSCDSHIKINIDNINLFDNSYEEITSSLKKLNNIKEHDLKSDNDNNLITNENAKLIIQISDINNVINSCIAKNDPFLFFNYLKNYTQFVDKYINDKTPWLLVQNLKKHYQRIFEILRIKF